MAEDTPLISADEAAALLRMQAGLFRILEAAAEMTEPPPKPERSSRRQALDLRTQESE